MTRLQKHQRDLLQALPPGYQLRADGATHLYVIRPDGTLLRDPNGQTCRVSGSPGSTLAWNRELRRILKAIRTA